MGPADIDPGAAPWFREAAAGGDATSPPVRTGEALRVTIAHPILGADGRPRWVLLGNVNLAALSGCWSAPATRGPARPTSLPPTGSWYSARGREFSRAIDVVRAGGGATGVDTPAARAGLKGGTGATEATDYRGNPVLAGYAPVPSVGWAVVAKEDRAEALAGAGTQRTLSIVVVLLAAVVLAGDFLAAASSPGGRAGTCTGWSTKSDGPVRRSPAMPRNCPRPPRSWPPPPPQQSAAVTQISATMEELARTAGAIAQTVDRVATQLNEARDNLKQAQGDIAASGERALALSGRVNEVGAILGLINESPTRPTCWRSTPRSRRRGPARAAAASRSSPTRYAAWPSARRPRPPTSARSSPGWRRRTPPPCSPWRRAPSRSTAAWA